MKYRFLPSDNNVKIYGRTIMQEGCRILCTSGSGIEFEYTGTGLEITFLGDSSTYSENSYVNWRDSARVQVCVDGRVVLDTTIKKDKETYTICEENVGLPNEKHVVKIIKLSEPRMSLVAVGEIMVQAEEAPIPTPYKEKYVEFIGDSITCGYGIDTEDELCPFSTGTENVTKAYAYLAANELNIDYSMVSYSGHGLVSGWTPDCNVPNLNELVQPYYDITAYSYNTFRDIKSQEIVWGFERIPDVIVINLGTNDFSYTQRDASKMKEFENAYVQFIHKVRGINTKSHIICSLGIMGNELFATISNAVDLYRNQFGDSNVSTFEFSVQTPEIDGYAADYHPSAATHVKAAVQMAEELKKWI